VQRLVVLRLDVEAAAMTAAASRADATNLNDKANHTASHGEMPPMMAWCDERLSTAS
jgi:hypothetical protein